MLFATNFFKIFHYFCVGARFVDEDFLCTVSSADLQYLFQKIEWQLFQKLLSFYVVVYENYTEICKNNEGKFSKKNKEQFEAEKFEHKKIK